MQIRRRFMEYEIMKRITLHNSQHLSERDIRKMLDDMNVHWDNFTFIFEPRSNGWRVVKIICNNTDTEVLLDTLSPAVMQWYVRQLKDLMKKQMNQVVQKAV